MRVLEPNKVKHIEYVHSITYRAVTLNFFRKICEKVTLHIEAGDRIVIIGNSNTYKEYIFYLLDNKLFDSDEIRGDVVINGKVLSTDYSTFIWTPSSPSRNALRSLEIFQTHTHRVTPRQATLRLLWRTRPPAHLLEQQRGLRHSHRFYPKAQNPT